MDDRVVALEARLAALEDEREIRELLARYGYYADAPLDEEYFDLFTDDCVMDVSAGRDDDPYEVVRWEGLAQMREFLAVRSAAHGDGFRGRSLHVQGNNLTVRVAGANAAAHGYSFILHQDGLDLRLLSASLNEWGFRKEAGRWKIRQRIRRMPGAPDAIDLLGATIP